MNKSQLVSSIASKADISQTKAEQALQATLDTIITSLTSGIDVSLVGFGSFGVKTRAARKVRNPRTGAEMMVNETIVPYFKPGKNLKESVDQKETESN
jgi:DNA-binding protein HU-beta